MEYLRNLPDGAIALIEKALCQYENTLRLDDSSFLVLKDLNIIDQIFSQLYSGEYKIKD